MNVEVYNVLEGSTKCGVSFKTSRLTPPHSHLNTSYWADYWNKLDFFLVMASVIAFIFEHIIAQAFTLNASIFRILRLARLTKALKVTITITARRVTCDV